MEQVADLYIADFRDAPLPDAEFEELFSTFYFISRAENIKQPQNRIMFKAGKEQFSLPDAEFEDENEKG